MNAEAKFSGDVGPEQTWISLQENPGAYMVDVRTDAEWTFVGAPDLEGIGKPLWRIAWKMFPEMTPNERFFPELTARMRISGATDVYFICRSGARSRDAALAGETALRPDKPVTLHNVADGFEGGLCPKGRRGVIAGWKARGLPWRQG